MNKTVVYVQNQAEQFLGDPQIAFITNESWVVRGVRQSQSGLFAFCVMPELPAGVPVVNLEPIKNDPRADRIIKDHISPDGVDGVDTLVRLLQGLGAQVMYSVSEVMPEASA